MHSIKQYQEDLTSKLKCTIAELEEKLAKEEEANEQLKQKFTVKIQTYLLFNAFLVYSVYT